jgi:predicted RecA/RadA family phage recombinase
MAQASQGRYVQEDDSIDYTPGSDVALGSVIVQGSIVAIATHSIEASTQGAIAVRGIFDVVKINGAISAGEKLYWDPTGNPQGGTAGTGGATTTAGTLKVLGYAIQAAGATDEIVRVELAHA